MRFPVPALILALAAAAPAAAEVELSFYLGVQEASHSNVDGIIGDVDGGGGTAVDFTAEWEGRSFEGSPYYGLRGTYWINDASGVSLNFTHSKVYATDTTMAANGFDKLELTDGINVLTLNYMHRFRNISMGLTPYVGAGAGVAIPHVDVTDSADGMKTYEYQLTGGAVSWLAGASYPINDRVSVFGEYMGSYSMHDMDLVGGGNLKTNIVTHNFNAGLSLSF